MTSNLKPPPGWFENTNHSTEGYWVDPYPPVASAEFDRGAGYRRGTDGRPRQPGLSDLMPHMPGITMIREATAYSHTLAPPLEDNLLDTHYWNTEWINFAADKAILFATRPSPRLKHWELPNWRIWAYRDSHSLPVDLTLTDLEVWTSLHYDASSEYQRGEALDRAKRWVRFAFLADVS